MVSDVTMVSLCNPLGFASNTTLRMDSPASFMHHFNIVPSNSRLRISKTYSKHFVTAALQNQSLFMGEWVRPEEHCLKASRLAGAKIHHPQVIHPPKLKIDTVPTMMGLVKCISFELSYFGYFGISMLNFRGGGYPTLIQTGLASTTNQRAETELLVSRTAWRAPS